MLPRAELAEVLVALAAFLLFGLLASGTYLLNDLLDVDFDRRHPRKVSRPIASGDVSLPMAVIAAAGLIGAALIGAAFLRESFALILLGYLAITLAYSLALKRIPLLDVLVIASLFTLRIVAGMLLVGEPPSEWLPMFSIFFFLSLALMKREVELGVMRQTGTEVLQGRGYTLEDRMLLICFGASTGVASLIVFALFVSSISEMSTSPYVSPLWLWAVMACLTIGSCGCGCSRARPHG